MSLKEDSDNNDEERGVGVGAEDEDREGAERRGNRARMGDRRKETRSVETGKREVERLMMEGSGMV